jgi:hypothetical protein
MRRPWASPLLWLNNFLIGAGTTHEGLRTYFQDGQPRQLSYSSVGSPSEDRANP